MATPGPPSSSVLWVRQGTKAVSGACELSHCDHGPKRGAQGSLNKAPPPPPHHRKSGGLVSKPRAYITKW